MKRRLPSSFRAPLKLLPVEGPPAARPLRMAVDLSIMPPGGESGGVKPFAFEYLRQLADLEGERLVLVFLTGTASHHELRDFARAQDELVCVRETAPATADAVGNWRAGEVFLPDPPPDLLLRLEADLLYSPMGLPQFACPGIPIVSTIVDVLHRDYPFTLTPQINAVREDLFLRLVQISDSFQCISHYTAGRLQEHFAVPPARMFCSHIPIHHRLEAADAERQSPPIAAPYFFYPANSWKHKNHESLLVAYHHYRAHGGKNPWDLVLTGHEDERMRLIVQTAEDLGLRGHVHFFGHLPDGEFTRIWRNAGALVFPSLHEGFGIPLVEAMHFGIPIIASTAGSLPEVAGDAAVFEDSRDPVAWAKAMDRVARDEGLRAELSARGRRRLAVFSLAEEIAEFREAINTVTSRRLVRVWHKGLHPDGWIERLAILGLPPSEGALRIRLQIGPGPANRRLRIYVGQAPYGGFDVLAGVPLAIELETESAERSLVLEVPDAGNLSPDDHRIHGVLLATATATDATGRTFDLTKAQA